MKKIFTLCIVFVVYHFFFYNCCYCSKKQEVSSINKYDTVDVVDRDNVFDARVYFFIRYPSCNICINNMKNIIGFLQNNKGYKIEFVIFVEGASSKSINFISEELGWEGEIYPDKNSLFFKYYKMQLTNTFIILGEKGVYYESIDLSGDKSKVEYVLNILNDIKKKECDMSNNELVETKECLKEIKDICVSYTAERKFQTLKKCYGLYSDKTHKFYFIDKKSFFIINSKGNINKEIDLIKEYKLSSPFFNINWKATNKSIIIHATHFNKNVTPPVWENLLWEYDIFKDTLSTVVIDSLNQHRNLIEIFGEEINNGYIIVRLIGTDVSVEYKNGVKPFLMIDSNGRYLKRAGNYPDIYVRNQFSDLFHQCHFTHDKNNYFSLQPYCDFINVFDKAFNIVDTIFLNLSGNKRILPNDLKYYSKDDTTNNFMNNVSVYRSLLYNESKNVFLVHYTNKTFPEGNFDYATVSAKSDEYIEIFNRNGDSIYNYFLNLNLPSVLYFNNDSLYVSYLKDNELHIKQYALDIAQ